ncbi:MAG: NlpC/P60 family protein [Pseudomonadota bacterium]
MPRIASHIADVWETPERQRLARQFLYGDLVEILEDRDDLSKIRRHSDSYEGWISKSEIAAGEDPTHFVRTFGALAFAEPDIKSPNPIRLPFHAALTGSLDDRYLKTPMGYVPLTHLSEDPIFADDPVEVAQKFLGVPYLWGGNTELGLDCSGLVQRAFAVCGIAIPADSGDQWQACTAIETPSKGGLVFWKGHVALMADDETLIHANAHHMAVAYEPLADALKRIEAAGDAFLGYGRVSRQTG